MHWFDEKRRSREIHLFNFPNTISWLRGRFNSLGKVLTLIALQQNIIVLSQENISKFLRKEKQMYLISSKNEPCMIPRGNHWRLPQQPWYANNQLQQSVSSNSCRNSDQIPDKHKSTEFTHFWTFKKSFNMYSLTTSTKKKLHNFLFLQFYPIYF